MRKQIWRLVPVALMLFLLSGCLGEENLTALDPKGPAAQWIYDNMLLSIAVMTFVSIVVFVIFSSSFLNSVAKMAMKNCRSKCTGIRRWKLHGPSFRLFC